MKFAVALVPFVAYLASFAAAAPADAETSDIKPEGFGFHPCPHNHYYERRANGCVPDYCRQRRFEHEWKCRHGFSASAPVARDGRDGRGDGRGDGRDHDRDDQHWHNGRCDDGYVISRSGRGRPSTCVWAGCYSESQRRRDNGEHCCPTDVVN